VKKHCHQTGPSHLAKPTVLDSRGHASPCGHGAARPNHHPHTSRHGDFLPSTTTTSHKHPQFLRDIKIRWRPRQASSGIFSNLRRPARGQLAKWRGPPLLLATTQKHQYGYGSCCCSGRRRVSSHNNRGKRTSPPTPTTPPPPLCAGLRATPPNAPTQS
jgi:hypothetical protein